jgi:hypothetical protein
MSVGRGVSVGKTMGVMLVASFSGVDIGVEVEDMSILRGGAAGRQAARSGMREKMDSALYLYTFPPNQMK